jgi:hypothetical protein
VPTSDPLIATIDRAIALYPKAFPSLDDCPEEETREYEAEMERIQKEYVQLTCDAFQRPAESLEGVLAKARLAYRITVGMGDTEGPVEDMTPPKGPELDDRMLLWSILRDLERLASSETKWSR